MYAHSLTRPRLSGDNGDLFPADLCERLTGLGIDSDDLYLPERGE